MGVTYLCFPLPQRAAPSSGPRTNHPHSPGSLAGQASPREQPRSRDPEVSFDFLARPLEILLLPGRGLPVPWVAVETASMAAPRLVSSRSVLREEASGSADSPITTRTPVPAVSPGSPEVLVSPPQVAEPPGKSLWDQICEGRRPAAGRAGRDAGGTRRDARSKPLCARRVTRAGGGAEP